MTKSMHFLDVLYYHYYLFYTRILKDPDPHLTTTLSLSFCEALLINGIIDTVALIWFCYKVGKWFMFGITVLIIALNYKLYHSRGKLKKVLIEKPFLWNNRLLSIIISWVFFLATASWLFWGPIYGKHVLSQCW